MLRVFATVVVALVAASACSRQDETPADAGVSRPGNPFFGSWRAETAQVAPWWDGVGAAPQMNPDFQNTMIVLAAGKSSGPELLACDAPVYAVSLVSPETLFEGNLPNPLPDAAGLGLPSTDIQSLNVSCSSGDKDVSLDFPMVTEDTILLGLDSMIYTLKRQPS